MKYDIGDLLNDNHRLKVRGGMKRRMIGCLQHSTPLRKENAKPENHEKKETIALI